ncbi:hypothetical protein FYJ60_07035 [Lachnospiraceae bacterium Oil+RF-744-WCA-WT-13]|jgi:hypothetical protein|uniref:Uncharacterized protein n=1 Tax=Bilifractor porci TaxID=2606636 RepID=A0A7X2P8A2_9FIRM|nr:hypothetical protein [Bilifractor porci]
MRRGRGIIRISDIANLRTDGVFMAEPVSNVVGGITCFCAMLLTIWPELNRMASEKERRN